MYRHISFSIYSIRCGVLFICLQATPNAYRQINEQLHTFFLHITHRRGVDTVKRASLVLLK
nr:MAG TPA: hypothetical protein [Caudoviricetes sp.]